MYKRQTLGLKKRRGERESQTRWRICTPGSAWRDGFPGKSQLWSVAVAIDPPRPSGPAGGITTNQIQRRRALSRMRSRPFSPSPLSLLISPVSDPAPSVSQQVLDQLVLASLCSVMALLTFTASLLLISSLSAHSTRSSASPQLNLRFQRRSLSSPCRPPFPVAGS